MIMVMYLFFKRPCIRELIKPRKIISSKTDTKNKKYNNIINIVR